MIRVPWTWSVSWVPGVLSFDLGESCVPVLPAAATALDLVDAEVRELVRLRGLDPAVDPGPVRALARQVVADYAGRASSSSQPPLVDPEGVLRDVLDRVAGFGPLQRWLDDPEVQEIRINCRP